MSGLELLAKLHPNDRDRRIRFRSSDHTYHYDHDDEWGSDEDVVITTSTSIAPLVSVTTITKHFFQEFDPDIVIPCMMRSKNWPNSKYFGNDADTIKQMWKLKGTKAAYEGTKMHQMIEFYYNHLELTDDLFGKGVRDSPEFRQFNQFACDALFNRGMVPYRTEWKVYDDTSGIAGTVDMVYKHVDTSKETAEFSIVDWKRTRELKEDSAHNRGRMGKGLMRGFPDCNVTKYSLQLNIYRHILENVYKMKIREAMIVAIHPESDTYKIRTVDPTPMRDVVQKLFAKMRKDRIRSHWKHTIAALSAEDDDLIPVTSWFEQSDSESDSAERCDIGGAGGPMPEKPLPCHR